MSELLKIIVSYFTNFFTEENKKNGVSFLIIVNIISIFTLVIKFIFGIKNNLDVPNDLKNVINNLFNLYVYGVVNLIICLIYFCSLFFLVRIVMKFVDFINYSNNNLYLDYSYDEYQYFQYDILLHNVFKLIKTFYFKIYPFILIAYTLTNDISYKSITKSNHVFFISLSVLLLANSVYILNDLSYKKDHGRHYDSNEFFDEFTIISKSESAKYVGKDLNKSYFLCFSNNNKLKLYYIFKRYDAEDSYFLLRNFYEYDEVKRIFSDLNDNIIENNKKVEELKENIQKPPFNPEDQ
ncbi:hypothetical protein [Apilactobacillus xinyiensis]|uniref:hypothetical protein n=1 Tax=Apilactobacillus xinyiensis TaxID=2841032 RepID=UPI0020102F1F|nr:hypothetical protein [Apilactobacillus xinyiensis]MCL0319399.1 hypothetical protein [Apilactobacillus xinyiensis]